jgi:DALR anticodon binding domain
MSFMPLDRWVGVIQYPSLVQWLADRLAEAIAGSSEVLTHLEANILDPAPTPQTDFMALPLFTLNDRSFGTFSSPLLLKLIGKNDVLKIGEDILKTLACDVRSQEFSPHFWINSAGWLYAEFSPEDLTTWLQHLIAAKPMLLPSELKSEISEIELAISSDPVLFGLQHVHARCHSLLRLAEQEKFLQLEDWEHFFGCYKSSLWQTDAGELYLQTKSEKALLNALMQFPQSLSPQKEIYGCHPFRRGDRTPLRCPLPPQHLYKQAILWEQLFSDFHRDSRLFGSVQQHAPQLAHARLALVYIVKNVVAFLLEDILRVTAPLEL